MREAFELFDRLSVPGHLGHDRLELIDRRTRVAERLVMKLGECQAMRGSGFG